MKELVYFQDTDSVRIIYLNHPNKLNPFNFQFEIAVKQALREANTNPSIQAIIVYGGKGRSFGAGGDFNEVKNLSQADEVDEWVNRIIDLYLTVLEIPKPTVACLEGFAIGMSLQFGLMFDWRFMATNAELSMPELKHGIGCSIGAAILEHAIGYNLMKEIIYGCERLNSKKAVEYHLVNCIYPEEELLEQTLNFTKKLIQYPTTSFQKTKASVNDSMIQRLLRTAEEAKKTHRACFAAKSANEHFAAILGAKY